METAIPKNLQELMAAHGQLIRSAKRQTIQTTSSQRSFFLVKSGYIKRFLIRNDGSLSIDIIYGPGDVFSLTLIFHILYDREILASPEIYYYEAITDNVELYSLPAEELKKHIENAPILYRDLLNEAGKRMTYETHGLENISMKSSYSRLAHKLVFLANQFGTRNNKSVKINMSLTHQDLADILSLTRETVSNNMGELRKKGFIKTNRNIVIPDVEKLQEEAFS